MTHGELRELLPAYVLGALEVDEAAEIESHLRSCRDHDEELMEFQATAFALGTLTDDQQPSPRLVARIDRLASGRSEHATRTPRPFFGRWPAVAAAVLALAVFGGGWFSHARLATPAPAPVQYSYVAQSTSGALVQFDGVAGRDVVRVTMAGLPRQIGGTRYQLWAIRNGDWLRIGVCNTDAAGGWVGDFKFALAAHEEVAVTIEPVGGSPKPTSDAILRTRF